MPDVVTIGETMVVFDSTVSGPLRYARAYTSHTGGAESNVAVGIVRQGHTAGWISAIGCDEFGKQIIRTIRGEGVDTSHVIMDPDHSTGIFFREAVGNGEFRNIYYRQHSAFSSIRPECLDASYIAHAKYLVVSGITMAVSPSAAATAFHAMELARNAGVKVCFDPNLRLKMWTLEEARAVLEKVWPLCDMVLPGIEEGNLLFDTAVPDEIAHILMNQYQIPTVIIKTGADGAIGYEGAKRISAPGFPVHHVVDAFGAGDAFCSGVVTGYLNHWPLEKTLRYANAIGALTVSAPGNIEAIPDAAQVHSFLAGQTEADR